MSIHTLKKMLVVLPLSLIVIIGLGTFVLNTLSSSGCACIDPEQEESIVKEESLSTN